MAGAPKGNNNSGKNKPGIEPLIFKFTCNQELTLLLRQAFYSDHSPHRWPEDNNELGKWVRANMKTNLEQFARMVTDWELFETDED